jgi:hypothetical protein
MLIIHWTGFDKTHWLPKIQIGNGCYIDAKWLRLQVLLYSQKTANAALNKIK